MTRQKAIKAMLGSLPFFLALLLTGAVATAAFAQTAAAPKIENRPPKPDEWGYRPAENAAVRLNPPSLTWVHETPEAQTYTVQWARAKDFPAASTVTAERVPWNVYTHNAPLAPGTYYWRYRFTDKDGRASNWSIVRSFTVPKEAAAFPMPTRAQQKQRVPEQHPRVFLRPEDLPRLRELAKGREVERFGKLRAQADKLLADNAPTPEPTERGSARDKNNAEAVRFWWPNRVQTVKACEEAETLAFVYLLTQDKKYGEGARRWILHLAGWDPDGPTNFALNCEAAKPLLHRLPRAYDWAYDALTPEDREKVRAVMRRRIADAWKSGEVGYGVGHLNRPYNSHGNRTWHKIGEAGIAFLGEIPEAEMWLDYAVNKFHAAYPTWSDDDGGWHEGVNYWAGYMSKVVWWLQASKSALGVDGLQKPFFAQVGDFPLYVSPPGSPNNGFGDQAHGKPSKGWGGWLEYFHRASAARSEGKAASRYWRWWSEQWDMTGEGGILGFLYAANLGALPEAKPPTDLPPSKVFHGIGVASLHSDLTDSANDVHLLFKSSPFGRQSHGHNPHNSFQLNAYGESLLTTCVYRDLHGSAFHTQWAWETKAHNAVLVNGEGQTKHSASPDGRVVAEKFTPAMDYIAGDATDAYGGRLTRYRRHVAFVKPDILVLYDDLAAKEPATFQFLLHSHAPFKVDEKGLRLTTDLPKAGVDVRYLPSAPLAFRQWDGYEPKPTKEFPNQWHVEAGTSEKRQGVGVLTVLIPYHTGQQRQVWTAERLESDTAVGVRLQRGGKTTLVAFRKEGTASSGKASLAGLTFDGPVAMSQ